MRCYPAQDIAAIYRVIAERPDMRHFLPDPIDPAVLGRLLEAAHQAPSVGLMQPWRFVRVTNPALRRVIHVLVDEERRRTADALGQRRDEFLRLKVEGILSCGEILVAALCDRARGTCLWAAYTAGDGSLIGRLCHSKPLARRPGRGDRSGLGIDVRSRRLGMPDDAKPVAILCLGYVEAFYPAPMLELQGWTQKARARGSGVPQYLGSQRVAALSRYPIERPQPFVSEIEKITVVRSVRISNLRMRSPSGCAAHA